MNHDGASPSACFPKAQEATREEEEKQEDKEGYYETKFSEYDLAATFMNLQQKTYTRSNQLQTPVWSQKGLQKSQP